ncbi:hypothetical protein CR205_17435 [Alteribacter lacisalsi]|uniref:Uncharacterized protein n=1 Tax=Alteribacter lacisalsi TaxID=2045244 RepID=A0A2W0H4Q5_9BACI|nr:DUF5327 family protein [Alteribacter lacisalsi]PYZ96147.1 hypothetical protein CR205_17435 [Alteribacter lacisalsi]
MNISARTVTAKMDDELNRIKAKVAAGDVSDNRFKEHVTALRTYCDLLLASEPDASSPASAPTSWTPPSSSSEREQSAMEILERQRMMGDLDDRPAKPAPKKANKNIYDSDEHGSSDNLLDF